MSAVAAQDTLFLQHDFHFEKAYENVDNAYYALHLTTALLRRLQHLSGSDEASARLAGDFKCNKFIANLEHLLRCLRQAAQEAIVRHCVALVEAHILHWHQYWQHQRRIGEGWFSEWPNSHRPLSTTWPWNVKPSLLVLWGVCWMFYGQITNHTDVTRQTRNVRGAAVQPGARSGASGDLRQAFGTQSVPAPTAPQAGTNYSLSS